MGWIVAVLLGLGVAVQLLCTVGAVLLPDALDRVHVLAPSGLSASAIVAAILVREGPSLIALQAALVAAFLLATGPVVGHVLARAIHLSRTGERP